MDDMQAPAPAEMEPIADEQAHEAEAPKAEKPEEKPQSEAEKRRSSIEKAMKAVSEDSDDDKPARGSQSTPKPDPKAEEKAEAKAEKPAEKAEKQPEQPQKAPEASKDAKEAPKPNANAPDAPSRFSADAKAAWKDAPDAVKSEVNRAVRELERGIAQKDEALKPLEPYFKMAKDHKVNLHEVVGRYVQMEQTLRQDPRRGLISLAQNLGMTPQQMAAMITTGQPGNADPRDSEILQLRQQIQGMQQQFGQVSQSVEQQRQASVMQQVQQFAASRPRFDELAPEIERLITTGYASDLSDAYEKAERLNPAPALADPTPPPLAQPAQTRQARSVTGAPSAGSNPGTRKPSANRTEAIQRAMRAAGLA
ncbi:hypothetical protein [Pararhodobacter sp. CCB-MM2]|uniref:hypothetical protein n=1 Tax=Pararhodobacter sp. CCB-MM2 TaxID=1786003 RepID=UPI00082B3294|nr:hypothetical protein [Pararhodobacter sp. CCB-MM2]